MPLSAGRAMGSFRNASSPPAEAPTPTIGKFARRADYVAAWLDKLVDWRYADVNLCSLVRH